MYRFAAIVECDTENMTQVETVRRKMQQAMKTSFLGSPYPVRGAVSPPEWIEQGGEPIIASPEIVTP